jgi:hypothetical protein
MAYAITDKPNTSAPDADYPFGNVRDKTISVAGTPVNTVVYADFHQFFAKLMDYAGVTPNSLPDNEYSGWQLMESLMALMGGVKTKIIQLGAWNMDSTATLSVAHGIAALSDIRSIQVIILRDDNQTRDDFAPGADRIYTTGTNIELARTTGGTFDGTAWDDASMNRGYAIIRYTEDL